MFKKQKKSQKLVSTLTDTLIGAPKKSHTKKKAAVAVGIVGTAAAVIANAAVKKENAQ